MNIVVSCILNFIPLVLIFILVKIFNKDFSVFWGFLALLLGLLAVVPIALMQFLLSKAGFIRQETLVSMLLYDLILNGLVEECFKMLVLFILPAKKLNFKDFFICSVLCGLTLASFENLIYLIAGTEHFGLRIFTSMIIHCCCAALSGVFVYSCKIKKVYFSPFIASFLIHGIYNYFAGYAMNTVFFYFSFLMIVFGLVECRIKFKNFDEKFGENLLVKKSD